MLDCVIRIEFAFSHEIIAYADDLLLLSYGFHCCTAVSNLQAMTDYFVYSLSSLMLQINARKSVFILFNRKKRPLPPLAIVIDQTSVCPSESTKYLGFEIDSKLTWRKHIEQRCASTIRVINGLRRYLRLTWGVDTNNLKILYKSVVLPTLLYGCSVWAGNLRLKWCKRKLRSTQRHMTRCIARSFKTVSSTALLVITNNLPADYLVLQHTCSRYFQLHSVPFAPSARKAILHLLENLPTNDLDVLSNSKSYLRPPWSQSRDIIARKEALNLTNNFHYEIYTDGSKSRLGVGAAAVIVGPNGNITSFAWKIPDHSSVQQAETYAILLATQRVLTNIEPTGHKDKTFSFAYFSDNQSIINMLNGQCKINSAVSLILRTLETNTFISPSSFNWLRSHSGLFQNELADRLSKQAAHLSTNESLDVPLCATSFKSIITDRLWEKWDIEWKHDDKRNLAIITREFFPSIQNARFLQRCFLYHETSQILTGHCLLNHYLYNIRKITSPACKCGAPDETVHHFVFDCQIYHFEREILLSSFRKAGKNFPCKLQEFSESIDLWHALIAFIKQSRRFDLKNAV